MSTALITGARGQVGRRLVNRLEQAGWDARGFDLRSGDDVRDQDAVLDAAEGCEVIVHAGAIAHDSAGTPADIVSTNVFGTWHVLLAAERWRVSRVIYFSTAQVFGFAEGEGKPDYLPVDATHPLRPQADGGVPSRCVRPRGRCRGRHLPGRQHERVRPSPNDAVRTRRLRHIPHPPRPGLVS